MQEEIKKIELCFENCELVTIDGKYIGEFNIDNIQRSIRRVACNYIQDALTCDHFSISIHREANKETDGGLFNDTLKLNRIQKYNDIVSVCVYLNEDTEDERVERIYVKWRDSDCDNEYQKSYMNDSGDLFIVIDKNSSLEDSFDLDEINDKADMDFVWSMYE